MASRRWAAYEQAWQTANPGTTVVEVPSAPAGGGLDLTSLLIGASIPLTLVLVDVGGKRVLRRRRETRVRESLA
jgi:hypothetical protein